MNKGLLAHIIASFIYAISVIFIFNGESIEKQERAGIVIVFFIFQFYFFLFARLFTNWHKENTKE